MEPSRIGKNQLNHFTTMQRVKEVMQTRVSFAQYVLLTSTLAVFPLVCVTIYSHVMGCLWTPQKRLKSSWSFAFGNWVGACLNLGYRELIGLRQHISWPTAGIIFGGLCFHQHSLVQVLAGRLLCLSLFMSARMVLILDLGLSAWHTSAGGSSCRLLRLLLQKSTTL